MKLPFLRKKSSQIPAIKKADRVLTYAHRGGGMVKGQAESTWTAAIAALKFVDGLEIDCALTADGVAIVTHAKVSKKNSAEFLSKHQYHMTLESWVDWFNNDPALKNKYIYIHLKTTKIDAYNFIKLLKPLGKRSSVGSIDPGVVAKLLIARKLLAAESEIYLQIPSLVNAKATVNYANKLAKRTGLNKLPLNPENSEIDKDFLNNLRPDGLHYYWPENILRPFVSNLSGDGVYISPSELKKMKAKNPGIVAKEGLKGFANVKGLHTLQKRELRNFVIGAKHAGYKIISGFTASPELLKLQADWGADAVMPDIPSLLPDELKINSKNSLIKISPPKNRFLASMQLQQSKQKKGTTLNQENPEHKKPQDPERIIYDKFAVRIKSVNPVRKFLGL